MQRYHAANCNSAVNNTVLGGASARDCARAESPGLSSNYSLNSRRQYQLAPYKLKCEKEPLNSRLGPPDYYPQTPDCPEETLNREYVQSGYKETVEGLEESRESTLRQIDTFTKPVVLKCKEAIRKRFRAINESRAQKRKAGQVYGVPLVGSLLNKLAFPEQRPCSEEFRRRWVEALSLPHKRLLVDQVPHGYRKRPLLEILIKNNVPLLRATWFVKVTYLNQVRPSSSSISSAPDKSQLSRSELWTKDVIDYMQYLLDEFVKNNFQSTSIRKDQSPQILYGGHSIVKTEGITSPIDGEEPSLHFKWWYMVRLMQWHNAEGILLSSPIIDWVLTQLQAKELLEILQLLLPILYGVIEAVISSQTYVRSIADVAVRFIREPSPGGSDLVDNSRRAYTCSAVVEILRYLILAIPNTFVALDCFPLPSCVLYQGSDGSFVPKASEDVVKIEVGSLEVASLFKRKAFDALYHSLSFENVVSSIQKLADKLTHAVSRGKFSGGYAQAVQALDRCLVDGDLRETYRFLFEDFCDEAFDSRWLAEVSTCLRSSLRWMGFLKLSVVYSVFFVCEWATCDYRNSRTTLLANVKYTGKKDYSRVHVAVWFLKLKSDLEGCLQAKNICGDGFASHRDLSQDDNSIGRGSVANVLDIGISFDDAPRKKVNVHDIFESPGPIHDILVCWIDQHERTKGNGLELLIVELTQYGLFHPLAYVRQLLISGIVDLKANPLNLEKRTRHYYVLKQLPELLVRDALKDAKIAEGRRLLEAMGVYANERHLLLQGLINIEDKNVVDMKALSSKRKRLSGGARSSTSIDDCKALEAPPARKDHKIQANTEELKSLIRDLMQFPSLDSTVTMGTDESEGSTKRPYGSMDIRVELTEGNSGCEECRRVKRQKLSDEKTDIQVQSPLSDDEDIWWARKGFKSSESLKVDPPLKSTKQASRGRQKVLRKTPSLAQLAASRIEGSQGASTSHVCDSRTNCPHHGPNIEGEAPKSFDWIKPEKFVDVVLIGKALKQLRLSKRRPVCLWLANTVRKYVDEAEKTSVKVGQYSRTFTPMDDRLSSRWKLGEEELSNVLYLLDTSDDLVSAVKLLLWLIPKNLRPNIAIHTGRSMAMLQRHAENDVCHIGEAFLVSSLRRYENTLVAADLIPLALSASLDRATALATSNNRVTGSFALAYTRYLLKKYGNMTSVVEWRKHAKADGDKRVLSELESGRSLDGEFGFPLGVPTGVEDLDDFLRQKITSGRLSRVGMSMREIVQRRVEEVVQLFSGKEKKLLSAGTLKIPPTEKGDDGYQAAEQIVLGIMECMKQTGGAAQEGDPSLVASAVSAIVGSVGPTLAKMPEFTAPSIQASLPLFSSALNISKQILRVHVFCLCILREALGERQSRVFEIALATESASAFAGASGPSKSSRNQYQLSPESQEFSTGSSGAAVRATKVAAAVSALLIGAIVQGVTSLERMISVFRLKEGLDVVQFLKSTRSTSNGNIRSPGTFKVETSLEINVHFFRLLIGNCRTLSDGLIVELLGEPSMIALSRMQQTLPLSSVFPPSYCIFAFLMWRPFIMNSNLAIREDIYQLYQSLIVAMGDTVKHLPFRNACLRDCLGLYDLIATDTTDLEFASMLELNGSDMHSKSRAFVPLRARRFLNAIIDCRLPSSFTLDDRNRGSGQGESKDMYAEDGTKLLDRLVHVLNTLQPAKFHWQWLELRLLLNEQVFVDKLENHDMSLGDALRTLIPGTERDAVSESEKYFIEIIMTRLLARPDAAPLFSEVLHLFGRSLDDSMLLLTKWFLEGQDVLFGRKTIRQRLINIAESMGVSTKLQYWKNWGWSTSGRDTHASISDQKKHESGSLEEGEVVEEGADSRRHRKVKSVGTESISQQHVTEKALIELVVPCINRSSDESRKTFASDLIKQLNAIEQQINAVTHGTSKSAGAVPFGSEGFTGKSNNRKGMRGGSPGLARRQVNAAAAAAAADSMPPSAAALRGSISLRLHFVLRLLPVICADREPMGRNLRHMLASVILRLLGSQLIYDDAGGAFFHMQSSSSKRDGELYVELSSHAGPCLLGESLFDWLLSVLHGLLSNCPPAWLKSKPKTRMAHEHVKDFSGIDKEAAENLQSELENMQLPDKVRWRIQAAMPAYLPAPRCIVSCQPPSVPASPLFSIPSSISSTGLAGNPSQKNSITNSRVSPSLSGKSKPAPVQPDTNLEVDAWTMLEDGGGAAPSSGSSSVISSGDNSNLRASYWLKGAVRVRRTDLIYVGAVDDDS